MKYLYIFLVLLTAVVWLALLSTPDKNFHLISCDVGQGDSMLLTYKNFQVLIDGGPNNKVLTCLTNHIPFYDKTIEVVILTHPESDHFTGLIDVFKNYKIEYFLANEVDSGTVSYSLLKNMVGGSPTKVINPLTGLTLRYDLIHLDILHPSQTFINSQKEGESATSTSKLGTFETKRNLNEFSIIGLWTFKDFTALTTGDIPTSTLNEVVLANSLSNITYLKVPHHGSKTGLTTNVLESLKPKIGVISVAKSNIYHLPDDMVLNALKESKVKTLRTDELGTIEVVTDGRSWWVK
ncbi:MAG TPA: hypothetical protein VF185_03300 [Patescibacteria group bacterium]